MARNIPTDIRYHIDEICKNGYYCMQEFSHDTQRIVGDILQLHTAVQ